jgi:hypothetical protein
MPEMGEGAHQTRAGIDLHARLGLRAPELLEGSARFLADAGAARRRLRRGAQTAQHGGEAQAAKPVSSRI